MARIRAIRNPIILLGAGASKPAGVPISAEMTKRMITQCRGTEYERPMQAIVGALQMQQSLTGRKLDVEQVVNASVLLADRLSLEFAPFVGAWHPFIDDLERRRFTRSDAMAIANRAMRSMNSSRRSERAATEGQVEKAIANALIGFAKTVDRRPDGAVFRSLSTHLTNLLINIVWLTNADKLSYLDPLLRAAARRRLTIATLNYDNSIELRAGKLGIMCETGLGEWAATGSLPEISRGVELLKLHGSANWTWSAPASAANDWQVDRHIVERLAPQPADNEDVEEQEVSGGLAVLFGGHNKLTAEGPFLDLLVRFRNRLFASRGLVVIGYSFRDPHINHYLLRWLRADRYARMIVVDAVGAHEDEHPFFDFYGDEFGKRLTFLPKGARGAISILFGGNSKSQSVGSKRM